MDDPFELCPRKKDKGRRPTNAVVVAGNNRFVGSAPAGFKSVIRVWKKICGASRVVESTGSARIAGP